MMNPHGHLFWWALTSAAVLWYSTVTVYVAIRGAYDIRGMLRRLDAKRYGNSKQSQ